MPVTATAQGAFSGVEAEKIVLPNTLSTLDDGAFQNCNMEELVLFDNLSQFGDGSLRSCEHLKTLYINAVEPPYGCAYRRESCYADKVDLLINAWRKRKLVCYGGIFGGWGHFLPPPGAVQPPADDALRLQKKRV